MRRVIGHAIQGAIWGVTLGIMLVLKGGSPIWFLATVPAFAVICVILYPLTEWALSSARDRWSKQ